MHLSYTKTYGIQHKQLTLYCFDPKKSIYFPLSFPLTPLQILQQASHSLSASCIAFQLQQDCNIQKMEKSMVQQLSILTHSTVFSSRPSFTLDPDRPELRRSRIQNLPGYRKQDLSAKLNFVVVFQTIQIQRLTQQVQTLRIMARDADRQRLNFENYQVQIRQLTQRCHAYEVHRQDLQDELQRMKAFCSRLVQQLEEQNASREQGLREKYQMERSRNEQMQGELDRWRNRYAGLELARAKQLEQVRQEFESRRRSQISRQTRELTIKHENQVAVLSGELRKAREQLQMRIGDLSRLQQLMGKFQVREEEMRQVEQKMYEYENRFVLLSQQNYRLNEMLRKRSEDLERARREGSDFKAKADSRVCLQEELTRLQSCIQEKTALIGDLQRQLRISSEQKEKLGLQCQKGQNYVRLVDELQAELQRINGVLRDKVNEGDQLRTNQRILQSKLSGATSATQKQFAAYEERIISFTREQERLSAQLRHRLAESEQLKVRCNELQRASLANQSLRQENQNLRGQLGQYNNKMEQFKRKIKLHEQNLSLMEEIQQKLRNQEQMKRELMTDRQKLNATVRQLTLRADTATQKAQTAQESLSQLAGLEAQLRECKQRLAWMTQQLDRVNNEIQLRVAQLHQMRQNIKSLGNSKANYQGIQQRLVQNLAQMQKLVLQLDHSRRQNDRLHNDNMNMEASIRSIQGQIINLQDQRDDRNRLLNAQSAEVHELRQKIEFHSSQIKVREQLQLTIQEQQKKMENFKAMYAQLEERLIKETAQSQAMVLQLMQMRAQPRVSKQLSEQLVALRRQAEDQRVLIENLVKRIQVMHGMMRKIREKYGTQMQELSILKTQINQLINSSNCIDDIYLLLNSYGERMECLRQEKLKLQSQKALIGVEYCQSDKVIQQTTANPPQQSIKNSSIAFKVSAQDVRQQQSDNNYLFTFKEVHRQQSLGQQDAINQKTERQENEAHSAHSAHTPDHNSMASSFINTLITKESTARYDLRPIQTENSSFGYNANSKLRYLAPNDRLNREQYHYQQRQIQNLPAQINRAISPTVHHTRGFFQNAGIKRVVSYTHFAPTVVQGSQLYPTFQSRDSPSPSALRSPQSPNTANATSDYSQFGKRIRIAADPARLLVYRQQH